MFGKGLFWAEKTITKSVKLQLGNNGMKVKNHTYLD
jgi:hypothetical protein